MKEQRTVEQIRRRAEETATAGARRAADAVRRATSWARARKGGEPGASSDPHPRARTESNEKIAAVEQAVMRRPVLALGAAVVAGYLVGRRLP
ncbi:MAG: hypothetical protein ABFS34_06270 [Gemmatimonadota bacterium]